MKHKQLILRIFIGLWIVLITYFIWSEVYKTNALKGPTKQSFGILIQINGSTFKHGKKAMVSYTVSGKEYHFSAPGNYQEMSVGDTVLIEYAVEDHSVARVVNKYYK